MTITLGSRASSAGYKLAAFEETGSTNTEAMRAARAGERGPMWFVTTLQTAGRGRRQRPWVAPRGNLASSVLEVLDVSPAVAATMGFAFGLAHEQARRAQLDMHVGQRRLGFLELRQRAPELPAPQDWSMFSLAFMRSWSASVSERYSRSPSLLVR